MTQLLNQVNVRFGFNNYGEVSNDGITKPILDEENNTFQTTDRKKVSLPLTKGGSFFVIIPYY